MWQTVLKSDGNSDCKRDCSHGLVRKRRTEGFGIHLMIDNLHDVLQTLRSAKEYRCSTGGKLQQYCETLRFAPTQDAMPAVAGSLVALRAESITQPEFCDCMLFSQTRWSHFRRVPGACATSGRGLKPAFKPSCGQLRGTCSVPRERELKSVAPGPLLAGAPAGGLAAGFATASASQVKPRGRCGSKVEYQVFAFPFIRGCGRCGRCGRWRGSRSRWSRAAHLGLRLGALAHRQRRDQAAGPSHLDGLGHLH